MAERKRKPPGAKVRLEVLKRDNYTCRICGRSPVTVPGLELEVDHIEPFSQGGTDSFDNYQTLCQRCNRGKGDHEALNRTLANEIAVLLDDINPEIRVILARDGSATVMANHEDFVRLQRANAALDSPLYDIELTTNVMIGTGAGASLGLHTVRDSGGVKANFVIRPICASKF